MDANGANKSVLRPLARRCWPMLVGVDVDVVIEYAASRSRWAPVELAL